MRYRKSGNVVFIGIPVTHMTQQTAAFSSAKFFAKHKQKANRNNNTHYTFLSKKAKR